jgi:glycine cleavage system H lipoate-binding protein
MTALMNGVEVMAVFVAGLLVRLGLAVLFALAFAVPILVVLKAWSSLKGWLYPNPENDWAGDLRFRPEALYAPTHAWLASTWRDLRVGLDDLAQRLVGVPTDVTLPPPGTQLRAGDPAVTLITAGRVAVLPAPVAGTVTAINDALLRAPSLVAREPYGRGWLYRIRPEGDRTPTLPTGEEARTWLSAESVRYTRALEHELGYAAADGGHPHGPLEDALDDQQWHRLAETFLRLAA